MMYHSGPPDDRMVMLWKLLLNTNESLPSILEPLASYTLSDLTSDNPTVSLMIKNLPTLLFESVRTISIGPLLRLHNNTQSSISTKYSPFWDISLMLNFLASFLIIVVMSVEPLRNSMDDTETNDGLSTTFIVGKFKVPPV